MAEHVDEQLPEFILGTLPPEARGAVDTHLARCAACHGLFESLSRGLLIPEMQRAAPVPADGLGRLLSQVSGTRRFAHLVPRVAALFHLDEAATLALLERVDAEEGWEEGPAEGVTLLPVTAGPGLENALAAVVRLQPGATFPEHAHPGSERVLVIQGGYREEGGVEMWRGDLSVRETGTSHAFTALEGLPCLCCSVLTLEAEER